MKFVFILKSSPSGGEHKTFIQWSDMLMKIKTTDNNYLVIYFVLALEQNKFVSRSVT